MNRRRIVEVSVTQVHRNGRDEVLSQQFWLLPVPPPVVPTRGPSIARVRRMPWSPAICDGDTGCSVHTIFLAIKYESTSAGDELNPKCFRQFFAFVLRK